MPTHDTLLWGRSARAPAPRVNSAPSPSPGTLGPCAGGGPALDINPRRISRSTLCNISTVQDAGYCWPGHCLTRLPLFPKLVKAQNGLWVVHDSPAPSHTLVSSMVTVATEAGVPEHILWTRMQSGHAQDRAPRHYVRLTNPDRLYDTWRAFRL